jgi:23S rRNA pseudouridine1911/1915/1917 synthase
MQGDKTGDKPLSEVVKEYIKDKYNKPGEVFVVCTRWIGPLQDCSFARTSKGNAIE